MSLALSDGDEVFKLYTSATICNQEDKTNLYYCGSTRDLWSKTNHEWAKCRSFTQAINRIKPIKESYIERG